MTSREQPSGRSAESLRSTKHQRRARSRLAASYAALIARAFERFYHEFAWSYDVVAWLVSRGLWYQWTLAALPHLRGQVLELGSGTGYMQNTLASAHTDLAVGLDESPQMLAHTLQRAQRSGRRVLALRGVAQALPFPTGCFQSVLVTFPSSYIAQPATLAEIRRVLRHDGRLVIVDGAHFIGTDLYAALVALAYRLTLQTPGLAGTAPRRHFYEDLLEEAGYRVEVHTTRVERSRVMIFVAFPSR